MPVLHLDHSLNLLHPPALAHHAQPRAVHLRDGGRAERRAVVKLDRRAPLRPKLRLEQPVHGGQVVGGHRVLQLRELELVHLGQRRRDGGRLRELDPKAAERRDRVVHEASVDAVGHLPEGVGRGGAAPAHGERRAPHAPRHHRAQPHDAVVPQHKRAQRHQAGGGGGDGGAAAPAGGVDKGGGEEEEGEADRGGAEAVPAQHQPM
mmetsp:Transcript_43520/g.144977  ORF Transcript_43520/g.144977 Transcript_43520/m.144977 type:complete len:206 (-) Transcript_43520:403-1020(-)